MSLKPEEAPSALLMMLFFFVSMGCVGVVKPLATSLCIDEIGFNSPKYPALYAGLALLAGPIVILFQHLAKRVAHSVLLIATIGIFLISFGIFHYFLFPNREAWVYYIFYAWSGLLSLLVPTLGWVISYDLYSIREAKRLFGLLATGGVLGGAAGSFSASVGHQERLQWQVLIFLVLLETIAVLVYRSVQRRARISRPAPPHRAGGERNRPTLKGLLHLPYVKYMAGLVLLAALATTLIDLNFQWCLKERFPKQNGAQVRQTLSLLLGTLYLLSACLNLFGQRILKRFGLPVLLLISPVALGGTSLFIAVFNQFWMAMGGKAVAGVLSPSLHRTGVEMLYVPLASRRTTLSLKSFIDLAVFKFGDFLGAVFFLLLLTFGPLRPVTMSAVLQIAAVSVWGFLALRVGKEYIRRLRDSVRSGVVVETAASVDSGQPEEVLLEALRSPDPVKVRLGLIGLRQLDHLEPDTAPQTPLEGESLMQTNITALTQGKHKWTASAASLLHHADPEVGAAALHLLVRHDPVRQLRMVRAKLNSEWLPEPAYISYLDRYIEHPGKLIHPANVLRWCQNLSGNEQAGMARVMGKSRDRAFLPILRHWIQQEHGPAGAAAIEAIGRFADPRFVPMLCEYLKSYWSRKAARRALSFYGESIVPHMVKFLREPGSNPKINREIPLILGRIRCSASRAALAGAMYHPDPVVSYRALQALNRIREVQELSYTLESFQPLVEFWARQYYDLINIQVLQKWEGHGGSLLQRALGERKRNVVARIFRTMELFLPKGDAYYCYRVIAENRQDLRDHAIELIDTQLNVRLKAVLIPLLAEPRASELAAAGRKVFNLCATADEVFSDALVETDPWMRCCILAAIREWTQIEPKIWDAVQRCCGDVNPLVRETAQWVVDTRRTARAPDRIRHAENN